MFTELKSEDIRALFINSLTPPTEVIPLDSYKYTESLDGDYLFWRLCYKVYTQTIEDIGVNYRILDWVPIEVLPHCRPALILLVDSMQAAKEFIKAN